MKSPVLPDNILAKARYGKDFFSELNLASKQQAASTKNLHFVDFDRLAQMAHNGTGLNKNMRIARRSLFLSSVL